MDNENAPHGRGGAGQNIFAQKTNIETLSDQRNYPVIDLIKNQAYGHETQRSRETEGSPEKGLLLYL